MASNEVVTGLFPVISVPTDKDNTQESYDTAYRRSLKWDFENGDFVRNGRNQVSEAGGYEAYATWCYKVGQTERGRCLAYPDSIGAELEYAMSFDDHEMVESMITRTITEAIETNPRTEYVRDFEYDWDGDELHISFKVKGLNMEDEITITI